ncbi:MAG: SHOCT domain-containing protein [Acidimicrobiia bacterium]|nr:SHOCT domain-containing protein [Acidimicrobiia bacterium]
MVLAESDFQTGQVFWSILWFFLFVLWIWLLITIFADIIRSKDLSGWGKALWTIAIIILPFLGVFMYLIVNGSSMGERAAQDQAESEEQFRDYVRDAAGSGASQSDQLAKLAELHDAGSIDDDEYAKAKARVLGD